MTQIAAGPLLHRTIFGAGRLQLVGHRHSEIAKRIDIAATAIFNDTTVEAISDLDLSYTPPLGSP